MPEPEYAATDVVVRMLGVGLATPGVRAEYVDVPAEFTHPVAEQVSVPEALVSVAESLAPGGHVTLIGMSPTPVGLTSQDVVYRQWSMSGSLIYDHPGVLRAEFALAEAAEAFDAVAGTPGKCWIRLDGSR